MIGEAKMQDDAELCEAAEYRAYLLKSGWHHGDVLMRGRPDQAVVKCGIVSPCGRWGLHMNALTITHNPSGMALGTYITPTAETVFISSEMLGPICNEERDAETIMAWARRNRAKMPFRASTDMRWCPQRWSSKGVGA